MRKVFMEGKKKKFQKYGAYLKKNSQVNVFKASTGD